MRKYIYLTLLLAMVSKSSYSGVVIGGTRIIFNEGVKEVSLDVSNPDKVPYLVQSWVEGEKGVPFLITPPVFRLDGEKKNVLRVVKVDSLPENKESMFWVSIKSIPSAKKKDNTLQLAVKTRIKLIYRPESLGGFDLNEVVDTLSWTVSEGRLNVRNPSPHFINFNEISIAGKKIENVTYVPPNESVSFALPKAVGAGDINFEVITDYGAVVKHKSTIK